MMIVDVEFTSTRKTVFRWFVELLALRIFFDVNKGLLSFRLYLCLGYILRAKKKKHVSTFDWVVKTKCQIYIVDHCG
jgi:hypothetical protein